jgi:hypothetical protein
MNVKYKSPLEAYYNDDNTKWRPAKLNPIFLQFKDWRDKNSWEWKLAQLSPYISVLAKDFGMKQDDLIELFFNAHTKTKTKNIFDGWKYFEYGIIPDEED